MTDKPTTPTQDENSNEIFTLKTFHDLVRKFDDEYKNRDKSLFGQMAVSREIIDLLTPKNMENNTPTQSLNERIEEIFFENTKAELIGDYYKAWETDVPKLCNAIERLILISQKELLTNIFYELGNQDSTPEYVLEIIQDEIVSINNTLNKLP